MQSQHPGTRLILIAERDLQVRKLQHFFLGRAGFDVEFADDGAAALERACLTPPALVVTEILIPKLDGLALCRRLRDDPRTRDVPVLVFTILAAEVRALEAGAGAFLRKPLVDSIFVAAVQRLTAAQATPRKGTAMDHEMIADRRVDARVAAPPADRMSTGNPEADHILGGGFPANSINIVMGHPDPGRPSSPSR